MWQKEGDRYNLNGLPIIKARLSAANQTFPPDNVLVIRAKNERLFLNLDLFFVKVFICV